MARRSIILLFYFLMRDVLFALLAIFLQLELGLDGFLVPARVVVHSAAFGALELDHVIL